jgi:hypothetical protein
VVLVLTAAPASSQAPRVTVDEVATYLGFDAAQRQRVERGEIVSGNLPRGEEPTELAIAVAAVLPATLDAARDAVVSGETLRIDRNILQMHEITHWPPAEEDFAGIGFGVTEADEAEKLLRFDGGATFNLGADAIEHLRSLRARTGTTPPMPGSARDAVSAIYRNALMERYRAYRQQGLGAVIPYVRGAGQLVDPARTLALAGAAATFFAKNEPALYATFMKFPRAPSPDVEHRFYWLKQIVQERPTFVLSHRMLAARPGYAVQAERQYYIGHSYNSVQIITGAFPIEAGIVVFYANRTSIDQLAGLTGRIARPIASGRLAERVTQRFEALRRQAPD